MTDINIKGISQGLLITPAPAQAWEVVYSTLLETIQGRGAFFKGARLVLELHDYALDANQVQSLRAGLEGCGVSLVAVLSTDPSTRAHLEALGLPLSLNDVPPPRSAEPPPAEVVDSEINSEEYGTGGVLIKRTLRSGRTVRSTGHVVVIGDVNPGAEIIAYGDVVVWGKLRGIVHAGANGDESANVCALDLAPTQLRIAGYISIPPSGKRRQPKPEMAHIVNGQIEAVAWL